MTPWPQVSLSVGHLDWQRTKSSIALEPPCDSSVDPDPGHSTLPLSQVTEAWDIRASPVYGRATHPEMAQAAAPDRMMPLTGMAAHVT